MISDTVQFQAEVEFYESVKRLSEKYAMLHEYAHLVNFQSDEEGVANVRKTFYSLMSTLNQANEKLLRLFETLCDSHEVEYK